MEFVKTAGLSCLWLVIVLLIPAVIRDRRRRPLWTILLLVSTGTTLYLSEVQAPLYAAVNGHLVFLGVHLASVVEAVGVLYLLAATINRPRWQPLAVAAGLAVAVGMIAIYFSSHPTEPTVSVAPKIPLAYWTVLSVFHALAHLVALALCWYAALKVRGAIRLSLVMLSVGMLLMCIPWAFNLGWLLTEDTRWLDPIPPIDAGTGFCLAVAAAPPWLIAAYRSLSSQRAMRRLDPLWRDLTGAVPGVVFSEESTGVAMPRRQQFKLYRRVIEIRDAMMVLRTYVTPDAVQTAERYVCAVGLAGIEAKAAVTACWIAAAIQSKDRGERPIAQPHDLVGLTGENLADEVTHLLRVARLYRSWLVPAYLAG